MSKTQTPKIIWFFGLPGSGKTTIANHLKKRLIARGVNACVLDGDRLRKGLCNDLGFDMVSREENVRRAAEVAKVFWENGINCLCSFITPTYKCREIVRGILCQNDLMEVYVNAPLKVCEKRDKKGLFDKARKGIVPDFTGISSPFDPVGKVHLELPTHLMTVEESVTKCLEIFFDD